MSRDRQCAGGGGGGTGTGATSLDVVMTVPPPPPVVVVLVAAARDDPDIGLPRDGLVAVARAAMMGRKGDPAPSPSLHLSLSSAVMSDLPPFLVFFADSLDGNEEEDEEDAAAAEGGGGNLNGRWPILTTTASPSSSDSAGYNPAAVLP